MLIQRFLEKCSLKHVCSFNIYGVKIFVSSMKKLKIEIHNLFSQMDMGAVVEKQMNEPLI